MSITALALVLLGHIWLAQAQNKPHIIVIVADDLGWDDVSFHGSPQIPTPNLDYLATRGVILNNYYVSPICTPTRASLMTGKYPIHLGMQHFVIYAAQPYGLPLGEITLPQYLQIQGYKTAGIGKWHLGFFAKEYTPTYRGFDSFYGMWSAKADYWNHTSFENGFWGTDMRNNMEPVTTDKDKYATEVFTREALKVIENHNKSEPLFLYIAHQAPHSANPHDPLQAPEDKVKKFSGVIDKIERQQYAAMVTCVDDSIGEVFRALEKNRMLNNSVILFTTDNGGAPHGFNRNQGSNYPLRGGKDMMWEGGVRGTAFIYSDLIKHKGRVSTDLIDVTDWVPTLYYLAGGTPGYLEPHMDGKNVWETISNKEPSPRKEVLHNIDPWRNFSAIRVEQYKLVVGQDDTYAVGWHPRYDGKPLSSLPKPQTLPGAIVTCATRNKSKICDSKNGAACLFDIEKDPCEYHDISKDYPEVTARLQKRLQEFRDSMLNVWYPPIDKNADPAKYDGFWSPWRHLGTDTNFLNALDDIRQLSKLEKNPNLVNNYDSDATLRRCESMESCQEETGPWIRHKYYQEKRSDTPPPPGCRFKFHYYA
ncbi:arylsulfatase B isoform X2 [Nematostella vectensis]|uniref:arylsulfatase B isoform X2 n=1 Tax=Nematostella vectensis TaxID=45351 RepID=UPI00207704AE|nr:arylsulfatase B isoform X2 [Nematostella vectensis]